MVEADQEADRVELQDFNLSSFSLNFKKHNTMLGRIAMSILFFITFHAADAQRFSGAVLRVGTDISQSTLQGTARFVGTGGVMGSVGGDLSNLSTNPAGLGMFSRTELSLTPSFALNHTGSTYIANDGRGQFETSFDQNRYKFTINSMGIVIANRKSDNAVMRTSNVTIGINRTADFNRSVNFGMGRNSLYSYSSYLALLATNLEYDRRDFNTDYPAPGTYPAEGNYSSIANLYNRVLAARNAEAIYSFSPYDFYEDPLKLDSVNVSQFGQMKTSGGITELSFAWSTSLKDKYYIGVSLGIPFINYQTEFIFEEVNRGPVGSSPNAFYGRYGSFEISEIDKYSGAGVNLKLGGLVKLTENLKASAYIHTPTFAQLTQEYAITARAYYANAVGGSSSPNRTDEFEFNYITPFKFGGGLSYMLGKRGFIGAEYEFNNLKSLMINLDNEPQFTNQLNDALWRQNNNTHAFKIGGEYVFESIRFRAGLNYRTTPYSKDFTYNDFNASSMTYTFGLGYRGKQVSLDLAYMNTSFKDYRPFYDYADNRVNYEMGYTMNNSISQFMATLNFRFK